VLGDAAVFRFEREKNSPRHIVYVSDPSEESTKQVLVMRPDRRLGLLPASLIDKDEVVHTLNRSWHIVPIHCKGRELPFLQEDPLLEVFR